MSSKPTPDARLQQAQESTTNAAPEHEGDKCPVIPRPTGESGLPGLSGFAAIAEVAPFLWLYVTYVTYLKPDRADGALPTKFERIGLGWRIAYCMDLALRAFLVFLILYVICKGLGINVDAIAHIVAEKIRHL